MGWRGARVGAVLLAVGLLWGIAACGGPPERGGDRLPTPTPPPTPTPLSLEAILAALAARFPTPTPQPTPTPIPLDALVASIVARLPPTPTPQPTPTPIPLDELVASIVARFPTPTPQPTPTPIPLDRLVAAIAAHFPTPTPQPTPTPIPLDSLVAAVLARLPTPTPTPPSPVGQVLRQIAPSVAFVEVTGGQGSGWAIGRNLVLTNAHVVGGVRRATLRWPSAPPVEGEVIAVDPMRDLALVRLPPGSPPLTPLPTRRAGAEDIGSPVLVVGYSLRSPLPDGTAGLPAVKGGLLSATLTRGGVSLLRVDAVMDPGDSGGPLVDMTGTVIGVNQVQVTDTRGGQRVVGVFYAVSIGEVEGFLRDWGIRP